MEHLTETQIDYNALGLARAGLPLAGLDGTVTTVYNGDECRSVYQQLRMRLDLFDESIVLTHYANGVPARCYEVSPDDVAAALANVPVTTGLLPGNCLFYHQVAGDARIGIFAPPQRRRLRVVEPEALTVEIPLPPLVFVGQGGSYSIFAVKGAPTAERTRLYHAPFPNVHNDGRICFGNVMPPACSATTIHKALDAFLESDFNTHLPDGKSAKHGSILEAWRALADGGAEAYPLDDLVADGTFLEALWSSR